MKKPAHAAIALAALAITAFFFLLAGEEFMQKLSGPGPLQSQDTFHSAEGAYVLYEAAFPVAQYAAEYYSGDQDRVRQYGYVFFDEERQQFITIFVPDSAKGDLNRLLKAVHQPEGVGSPKNKTPIPVQGTLNQLADSEIQNVLAALQDKESQTTEAMAVLAASQSDWYFIRLNTINGFTSFQLWLCAGAALVNLFIFLILLIQLVKPAGKADRKAAGSGTKFQQAIELQRPWVTRWCNKYQKNTCRSILLTVIICLALLIAIGFFVKAPIPYILTVHLPAGLLLGELVGIVVWLTQAKLFKPNKILALLAKNCKNILPDASMQEELGQNIIDAQEQWSLVETSKAKCTCVIVGEHFWAAFQGNGTADLVDSRRVEKIETETVAGEIRSGRYRSSYKYYAFRFFLRESKRKKGWDQQISLDGEDAAGKFAALIKRRVGDSIEIEAK